MNCAWQCGLLRKCADSEAEIEAVKPLTECPFIAASCREKESERGIVERLLIE